MIVLLLALIQTLPVCWEDRNVPRPVKEHQFETVAAAISAAVEGSVRADDEAVLLLTVAYHETRLCLRAHAGETPGRGKGLFQIEPGSRLPKPHAGVSLEDTTGAARNALNLLRRSWQCGRSVGDRLTAYAGRACGSSWPTLKARENTFFVLRSKLQRARRADRLAMQWARVV